MQREADAEVSPKEHEVGRNRGKGLKEVSILTNLEQITSHHPRLT